MPKIETLKKDSPKNKSVLLFSGGMDSYIISQLDNPDILLYLNHGQKYRVYEENSIYELINKGFLNKDKVISKNYIQLGEFERDDMIIPLRNLFFLGLASLFGEKIYLASVSGDRTLDKSKEFFNKIEELFNYLYQEQHWCKERKFEILAPYKDLTKTEMVKLYLEKELNPEALLVSYSCYTGGLKPCGSCKPCFRKWVALKNNNINTKGYFKTNPWESEWLPNLLPKIKQGLWRGKEDKDILKALDL